MPTVDKTSQAIFASCPPNGLGIIVARPTGTPANGDVWQLAKVPAGMRVIAYQVLVNDGVGATSATISLGFTGRTAFATGLNVNTTGTHVAFTALADPSVAKASQGSQSGPDTLDATFTISGAATATDLTVFVYVVPV